MKKLPMPYILLAVPSIIATLVLATLAVAILVVFTISSAFAIDYDTDITLGTFIIVIVLTSLPVTCPLAIFLTRKTIDFLVEKEKVELENLKLEGVFYSNIIQHSSSPLKACISLCALVGVVFTVLVALGCLLAFFVLQNTSWVMWSAIMVYASCVMFSAGTIIVLAAIAHIESRETPYI